MKQRTLSCALFSITLFSANLLVTTFPESVLAQQEGALQLSAPQAGIEAGAANAPTSATRAVGLELSFGTSAPIDAYGGATLVLWERLLLGGTLGRTVYAELLGSVVDGVVGAEQAGTITRNVLGNGTTFRLSVGLRPFGRKGPELLVGYGNIGASAELSATELGLPNFGQLTGELSVNTIFVELGWTITLGKRFLLRPAVGWTRALNAELSLASPQAQSAQAQQLLTDVQTVTEEAITEFGRIPSVSLSVGVRF